MPRHPKCRSVESEPRFTYFKPAGIPRHALKELTLSVDELEAIRLKDLEGLDQEECAQRMQVSRPTFQRILTNARSALAEAIIEGKAVRIEGGHYKVGDRESCPLCKHKEHHTHACSNKGPSGNNNE